MFANILTPAAEIHLARACNSYPELDVVDALVADVEAQRHPLARNTVRVYQHEYRSILAGLASHVLDPAACEAAQATIHAVLEGRISEDVPPRTSATKVKTITVPEFRLIFRALKAKSAKTQRRDVALAGLMLVALFVLFLRPRELATLEEQQGFLRVQSAKSSRHKPRFRYFDARRIRQDLLDAIVLAARTYGAITDIAAFAQQHRKLSQILGRISQEAIGRRISWYALRHTSIATLKRLGISGAEIAELVGHLTPSTARHYASAADGLDIPVVIKPVLAVDLPEGVFETETFSPLIKPPRAPRRPLAQAFEAPMPATAESDAVDQGHDGQANPAMPADLSPLPSQAAGDGLRDDNPGRDFDSLDIYWDSSSAPDARSTPGASDLSAAADFGSSPAGTLATEAVDADLEFELGDMPVPIPKPAWRPTRVYVPSAQEQERQNAENAETDRLIDELIAADDLRIAALKAAPHRAVPGLPADLDRSWADVQMPSDDRHPKPGGG